MQNLFCLVSCDYDMLLTKDMSYYILSPQKNSSFFKLPIDILFIILKITLRSFLPLLLYPPVNQMLKNENTLLPLRRILLPGFPQPVFYVISSQKIPNFSFPSDTASRYTAHSYRRNTTFQSDQVLSSISLHFSYKSEYFRESVFVLLP